MTAAPELVSCSRYGTGTSRVLHGNHRGTLGAGALQQVGTRGITQWAEARQSPNPSSHRCCEKAAPTVVSSKRSGRWQRLCPYSVSAELCLNRPEGACPSPHCLLQSSTSTTASACSGQRANPCYPSSSHPSSNARHRPSERVRRRVPRGGCMGQTVPRVDKAHDLVDVFEARDGCDGSENFVLRHATSGGCSALFGRRCL